MCFHPMMTNQSTARYSGQLHESPALSVCPWVPELVSLRPEMFQVNLTRKLLVSSTGRWLHSPVLAEEEPVIAAWLGPHGIKTKQNPCMGFPQTPCSVQGWGLEQQRALSLRHPWTGVCENPRCFFHIQCHPGFPQQSKILAHFAPEQGALTF